MRNLTDTTLTLRPNQPSIHRTCLTKSAQLDGHYPQFGIDSEYDVPDEVFMAIELQPGALSGKPGKVKYHAAFKDV